MRQQILEICTSLKCPKTFARYCTMLNNGRLILLLLELSNYTSDRLSLKELDQTKRSGDLKTYFSHHFPALINFKIVYTFFALDLFSILQNSASLSLMRAKLHSDFTQELLLFGTNSHVDVSLNIKISTSRLVSIFNYRPHSHSLVPLSLISLALLVITF